MQNTGNTVSSAAFDTGSGPNDHTNVGTNSIWDIYEGDLGNQMAAVTWSNGVVTYGAFTANHDVIVPEEYNEKGYPYGTLMCIINVVYSDGSRSAEYNVEACKAGDAKKMLGAYASKYSDKPNKHQVYVLGDGHILVNNENGNIEIGDPITTSSAEGIGMKANDAGMIIGVAQENHHFKDAKETKLIAVQYTLNYYIPQKQIQKMAQENEELKTRIKALEEKQ